ncbi:MAG: 4Fe-4S dicluster domain-containing protein [Acidobacteriota bacterium]|nr:4Fe-4S dicluster domain-containing protein [Acidobacteriota bacterium]
MATRKIIEINRDLCNGCGLCTTACEEGALALDGENKAVLAREMRCDGVGTCLGVCPTGALTVTEREGAPYAPRTTRMRDGDALMAPPPKKGGAGADAASEASQDGGGARSELGQWPIQLRLVSPHAPFFRDADLLVAADCTAFAMGGFHGDLLKGRRLVIACPKLDDAGGCVEKLSELLRANRPRSVTVAIMSVPCCRSLVRLVEEASRAVAWEAGEAPAFGTVVIGTDGVRQAEAPCPGRRGGGVHAVTP